MFRNWKTGDFHNLNNKHVLEKPAGSSLTTLFLSWQIIQPQTINRTKPLTCNEGDAGNARNFSHSFIQLPHLTPQHPRQQTATLRRGTYTLPNSSSPVLS
jgi:hypothetical protein